MTPQISQRAVIGLDVAAAAEMARDPHVLDARIRELFDAHADFVWRSLRRLGVHHAATDDAVQEVFLVVHRRLHSLRDDASCRAWLYAIARRVASLFRRTRDRAERRQALSPTPALLPSPDESVARAEAREIVERFVETLDDKKRVVFELSELEGMRAPEIAAALGLNLNTVYWRLRTVRKLFASSVSDQLRNNEERLR